jgi:predicted nucleic acid-binding protein
VTVVDTSVVIDFLTGSGVAREAETMMEREGELAAPDVLVFETLAVLRRKVLQRRLDVARATSAVNDMGQLAIALLPGLPLRERAWSLRHNLSVADAMFVALAESLGEPLATKDRALAAAAAHADVDVLMLAG